MDIRSSLIAWRLLAAIGEKSGLARAAESLDLDPGRASRLIHSLEAALECELLTRTERPLGLTEEARTLLPAAQEYIRAHERLSLPRKQLPGNRYQQDRQTSQYSTFHTSFRE